MRNLSHRAKKDIRSPHRLTITKGDPCTRGCSMKPLSLMMMIALVAQGCSHDLEQMQLDRAMTLHDMKVRWQPAMQQISLYEVISNGSCRKIRSQTCLRTLRLCTLSPGSLKENCSLQTQLWTQEKNGQWTTDTPQAPDN